MRRHPNAAIDGRGPARHLRSRTDDRGISLVEVIVAMAILAVIALAFFPVLSSNVKLSASSAAITTASALADARIAQARNPSASCASIQAIAAANTDAGNGVQLQTTSSVTCPTAYPATVTVTVTVTNLSTSKVLATAATIVRVTG